MCNCHRPWWQYNLHSTLKNKWKKHCINAQTSLSKTNSTPNPAGIIVKVKPIIIGAKKDATSNEDAPSSNGRSWDDKLIEFLTPAELVKENILDSCTLMSQ